VEGFADGDVVLSYGPVREVHVVLTGRCWKMPEGFSWKSAVCLDPADFAMGAVRDGQVRVGDAVAVFGMGAIGLMVVQIAKLSGAYPVIAVDPLENRRQAAEACGADLTFDPTGCDAGVEVKKATGNRGADVTIDYSGNVHALQAAIRAVAFGGNVVPGSAPAPYGAGLDFGAEAHINRPNLIFSRACSEPNREHPRWDEKRIYATCWRLLTEGKLTGEPIVTPVVEFEDLVTEYPKIASNPGGNIKLGANF
jgi:threonine dehydrogenase-like Zn-dependent dehydrogenase